MYLDTRQSREDPMPPWMYSYTLVTYDQGLDIYVNFVGRRDTHQWTYNSMRLGGYFQKAWLDEDNKCTRIRMAMVLQHIADHTRFVAEQHTRWFELRAETAMNKLRNRALVEQKNLREINKELKKLGDA